jgi:hypothetical protein
MSLLDNQYELLMRHAEAMDTVPNQADKPDLHRLQLILYNVPAMMTKRKCQHIVRSVANQNGFEAYRLLTLEYEPRVMQRRLALLMELHNLQLGSEDEVWDKLVAWEHRIVEYERTSGRKLDEETRLALVVDRCTEALKRHLQLNSQMLQQGGYEMLRNVIKSYVQARRSWDNGTRPMEVDALYQKGSRRTGRSRSRERRRSGRSYEFPVGRISAEGQRKGKGQVTRKRQPW